MSQSKKRNSTSRSKKKGQTPILVAVALGALLLIAAAVFFLSRRDDNSTTRQFDPNFEPEVTGAPRVEVPQDTVDHGEVPLGQTVQSVFRVRNVGDRALNILGEPQVELREGC